MNRLMRKDALAGLFLMLSAGFFLMAGRGLDFGTFDMMGPGFVPVTLALALLALGFVLVVGALAGDGAGQRVDLPPGVLRAIVVIFAAILAFVLLLRPAGYVVSVAVLVIVAGLASTERRFGEILIAALLLSGITAIAFIELLGLPMPLWPAVLQ
ncbi:MAG: tripartite tricarboxylate transporter TctB family protein [Paracoccus sp. BP8]|nr:MAG: tripartite tricarboxylate transporter TctB family protein [Paracoccus sp. BP8]